MSCEIRTSRRLQTVWLWGTLAVAACGSKPLPPTSSEGVLGAIEHNQPEKDAKQPVAPTPTKPAKTGLAGGRNPETPPMSLTTPPDDATGTVSGMFFKLLTPAPDGHALQENDTARVHYTAWKTSGELIFSTHKRGEPQAMPIFQAAPGWREMMLDMRVGERRICWMPGHLASATATMATAMMLVFEVEVIDVDKAPPVPTDLSAPPDDATTTDSGLSYVVLKDGAGASTPGDYDQVSVHYVTWKPSGTLHHNTRINKEPRKTRLFEEPKGFAEAVRLLRKGQKNRVWVPEALRQPLGPGDTGGLQVMEVELVDIEVRPAPPPTPKDVARPPSNAKQTALGVHYVLLKKGQGKQRPTTVNTVKVHYTGWTTDGNMFDSSYIGGNPAEFPLVSVIPGWTNVVQVMVVGDRIRTWIPEKLAYAGQPGRPKGMLVFEIELLEIVE